MDNKITKTNAESKDGSCPHCGEENLSDLITFGTYEGWDRMCNACGGGFDLIK